MPFGSSDPNGTSIPGAVLSGEELWRLRLATGGWSEDRLNALLSTEGCDPDAVERLCEPGAESIDAHRPFAVAAGRLTDAARTRLEAVLADADPQARERLPAGLVDELIRRGLHSRLDQLLRRAMLAELTRERLAGALTGDSGEARLACFVGRFTEPERRRAFYRRYPVLADRLTVVGRLWTEYAAELLHRLVTDLSLLGEGPVASVTTQAGDSHRGCRSVAVVEFSGGAKVVYKPRPFGVDVHFQELLTWVNARVDGLDLRTVRCLDRGEYGWMEFVETRPCTGERALHTFYRRQGALLAVLYLLRGSDMHAENLVVHGEHPVLIDLETLLAPRVPAANRSRDDSPCEATATELLAGSVIHAGLLPAGAVGWAGDAAGMNGRPTHSEITLPHVVAAGTDEMRIELRRAQLSAEDDEPGTTPRLRDYTGSVVDGFTEVYQAFCRDRGQLGAPDGPLAAFRGDQVRVLVRDTASYGVLLNMSCHPELLRDRWDTERHLDLLWREVARRPALAAFTEAERRALWRGDIPMFTATVDEAVVRDEYGGPVTGDGVISGSRMVSDQLARLGPADLARQTWLIRACLLSNGVRWDEPVVMTREPAAPASSAAAEPATAAATATVTEPTATGTEPAAASAAVPVAPAPAAVPAAEPAGPSAPLDAAAVVAQRLAELAVEDNTGVVWLGVHTSGRNWQVGLTGPDLYTGGLGIALFLGHFARSIADDEHADRARRAVATARVQIGRGQLDQLGLAGCGGALYALSELGRLWSDDSLVDAAVELAAGVDPLVERDDQYAVIEGSAGLLIGLASVHRAGRGTGRIRDSVRRAADHLVAARDERGAWLPRQMREVGLTDRPLAGYAHGAAGIASALVHAAEILGEERYLDHAVSAADYERQLFDPVRGNWRDLRNLEVTDGLTVERRGDWSGMGFPVAWCHGAPGIGLARAQLLRHRDDPSLRADLDAALETTLRAGFGNGHSLCHGDAGALELVVTVAEQRRDPALWAHVHAHAATVAADVVRRDWRCGLSPDLEVPGLFTGLAGIGVALLRAQGAAPALFTP